jgi:hypothetical protein
VTQTEPTKVGQSLSQLALDDPAIDLGPAVARLRAAGATEVYLASIMPNGVIFEASSAGVARTQRSGILARGRRVMATQEIDWDTGPHAVRNALERLVTMFQQFDKIGRMRFAASDMRLVAEAAAALIDVHDNDGPARFYERIIETGMVVTYARPFLESNEAGIGRTWWPKDEAERELHDELIELRHEYHAHAAHTPRRRLENATTMLGREGRPMFAESWESLPTWKLQALEELTNRLAATFDAEAVRLDVELFGPRET